MCLAIGAVVDGLPTTFQTPLSGQISPVRAVLPNGTLYIFLTILPASTPKGCERRVHMPAVTLLP